MIKKTMVLLLLAGSFMSCHKSGQQQPGCNAQQVCTAIFATIGIKYTDKSNNPIAIQNFTAFNQRTKKNLVLSTTGLAYITVLGYCVVADDNMKAQVSAEGDDILISATNPVSGQVKTTTFKISGGCNCHIEKLSGAGTVAFD